MPLVRFLEFAAQGLAVAYRASSDPQELTIDVQVEAAPAAPFAGWSIQAVCAAINNGAAGSDVFSPSLGSAERLAGPWTELEGTGTSYAWVLRVSAVAPRFVRSIVEELRRAGFDKRVTWMNIRGSLPLDASPMSVREADVRAWLDDPQAYPQAWPAVPFPTRIADRGASSLLGHLRVVTAGPIDVDTRNALEDLCVHWLNTIRNIAGEQGGEVELDAHRMLPRFAQSKSEFRAQYPLLPYLPEPARAMLLNMLVRFHETVMPIVEADLPL